MVVFCFEGVFEHVEGGDAEVNFFDFVDDLLELVDF
jgi:hypothetical protein